MRASVSVCARVHCSLGSGKIWPWDSLPVIHVLWENLLPGTKTLAANAMAFSVKHEISCAGTNTVLTVCGLFTQSGMSVWVYVCKTYFDVCIQASAVLCVTSRWNSCLEGALGKPCVRDRYAVYPEDTSVAGPSSGLLISMHGMSVEARGPETGTSSYCGPVPRIPAPSKSKEERRKGGKIDLISLHNRVKFIMTSKHNESTHSLQAAHSPSRPAPSVYTSPPYALSQPAVTWGTSGRHAGTPIAQPPPEPHPLVQVRCPSRGQEEAGWMGQSPPPRSHLRHKRGSGSQSPGCWRWKWQHHVSAGAAWWRRDAAAGPECLMGRRGQPAQLWLHCWSGSFCGD